jgi:hypothetical protein
MVDLNNIKDLLFLLRARGEIAPEGPAPSNGEASLNS